MNEQAKTNLINFQNNHKLSTRDEALEKILELIPTWEAAKAQLDELKQI